MSRLILSSLLLAIPSSFCFVSAPAGCTIASHTPGRPGAASPLPRLQVQQLSMSSGGSSSRRAALARLALLIGVPIRTPAASGGLGGVDEPSVQEAVRKMAAGLPGMGPPDVFFPPQFEGRWNVERLVHLLSISLSPPPRLPHLSLPPDELFVSSGFLCQHRVDLRSPECYIMCRSSLLTFPSKAWTRPLRPRSRRARASWKSTTLASSETT